MTKKARCRSADTIVTPNHLVCVVLTGAILWPYIYGQTARILSNTHNIARVATPLAQRGTSWCRHNPGPVFKPRAPIDRESCASWIGCLKRFKPRDWRHISSLIWALPLVVVARKILSHLTMRIPVATRPLRLLFFFAMVANEGSMESPRPRLSITMVTYQLSGQLCLQNSGSRWRH